MTTSTRLAALSLLLAFSAFALAGHPPKSPPPPAKDPPAVTVDTSVLAGAHAGAAALSGSRSSATGGSATAAGGAGGAGGGGGDSDASAEATGGQGVGSVDASDSSRFRSLALALSVPAATAAPAVPGECLVHSRGWQAGMGLASRSGGTSLQEKCQDRQHCLAVADRFQSAGLLQAMADQLATCGGVSVRVVVPPPVAPPAAFLPQSEGVTPEQLASAVQRLEQRQDAAFAKGLGK